MPRSPLPLGTWGKIATVPHSGSYRSRALFRDFDGATRRVEKWGPTKGAAERLLREALRDRSHTTGGPGVTPNMRVAALAEAWWADILTKDRSPTTLEAYRLRLDKQIIPGLGQLRVYELSVGVVDRHIKAVAQSNGPAVAKMVKTVLSGMCGLAARHDALERNPVRDTATVNAHRKKPVRALTLDEARALRAKVRADERAGAWDLPDLIDFMLATGCRIGEACAMTFDCIDFEHWTAEVRGTCVRLKGQGNLIIPTKTRAAERTLELPSWCVEMLKARATGTSRAITGTSPIFTAPLGGLRDSSNTAADVRATLDRAGFDWLTSHGFRRSVATWMDQAGLSARAAADQLGHSQVSTTMNHYYARRIRLTGAAEALEKLS